MVATQQRDPLGFLDDELDQLRQAGTYRELRIHGSAQGPHVTVDGKQVITLASNNYLDLCNDPRLKRAAIEAVEQFGAGSGAVRTIAGTMEMHQELERRLAVFKHTEATLTLQSGYAANLGVLSCIVGEGDVVVSDALNHASIIDGLRLTRAERKIYPHKDMAGLEQALAESRGARRILVVTDGVFSMDGDIAPLPEIVELAERAGATVMVDDAHASGVLGRNGRGTVDHFGLHGRVHIQVGTLSKAVGVLGGYVAGSQSLRDFLVHRARPLLFSTSHPPAVVAACLAALDVLESEPQRIERLWENTRFFKAGLHDLGFSTGSSETPITPVMVGGEAEAAQLSDRLFAEGIFAQPIYFPMVARGLARIRTIVSAGHSRDDLERCLEAFGRLGRELGILGAKAG
jgi:glycine C-acetyltransferase